MLAMLYKDERVANVAAVPQYPFLEKMLMERLITKCVYIHLNPCPAASCTSLLCAFEACFRNPDLQGVSPPVIGMSLNCST